MPTMKKSSDQGTDVKNTPKKAHDEHSRLNSLLNITKILADELDLNILLQKLMVQVKKLLNADRCTIFLLDEEKQELWSRVATGVKGEIRFPANAGIAGHVCQQGEIVNIADAYKDERFNPDIDKKTGYKTKSILTLPMRNKLNETIGVFQVLNKKDGPFIKEDEELLATIAALAASAIENAQLHEEQKKSFISFIETLATTLDSQP